MSTFKRSPSDPIVDLTTSFQPLPHPLTTKPLPPRADTPITPRATRGPKRRRLDIQELLGDNDFPEPSQPVAGPSTLPHHALDFDGGPLPWKRDEAPGIPMAYLPSGRINHHDENAVAGPSNPFNLSASPSLSPQPVKRSTPPPSNLLSTHTCPICFSTISNACLTPCGHVLCGACLFASVKSGIKRSLDMGIPIGDGTAARCPVCRAGIKGWDGRGGGIIPLKFRTIMAL